MSKISTPNPCHILVINMKYRVFSCVFVEQGFKNILILGLSIQDQYYEIKIIGRSFVYDLHFAEQVEVGMLMVDYSLYWVFTKISSHFLAFANIR